MLLWSYVAPFNNLSLKSLGRYELDAEHDLLERLIARRAARHAALAPAFLLHRPEFAPFVKKRKTSTATQAHGNAATNTSMVKKERADGTSTSVATSVSVSPQELSTMSNTTTSTVDTKVERRKVKQEADEEYNDEEEDENGPGHDGLVVDGYGALMQTALVFILLFFWSSTMFLYLSLINLFFNFLKNKNPMDSGVTLELSSIVTKIEQLSDNNVNLILF